MRPHGSGNLTNGGAWGGAPAGVWQLGADPALAGWFVFRHCEDASFRYPGFASHEELSDYDLYDTVVARQAKQFSGGN